jgi:hypothetical protein
MRYLILLIFLAAGLNLNAQLDPDRYYLSLGYGAIPSNNQSIELVGLGKNTSQNPITLTFDVPLNAYIDGNFWQYVSAGVVVGYAWNKFELDLGVGSETIKQTYTSVLLRVALHLKEKRGLVPYLGFQLGQANFNFKVDADVYDQSFASIEFSGNQPASGVLLGMKIGGSSSLLQGFIEVGTSIALLSAGVTINI